MKVVPQAFYASPKIEKISVDKLCSILFKSVSKADFQNERFLASHAITLVLNGALRIESTGNIHTVVNKDEMVFLPKGLYMISDIIPKGGTFDAVVFFFDDDLLNRFLIDFDTATPLDCQNLFITKYHQHLQLFTDNLLTLYRYKQCPKVTVLKLLELLHLISISGKGNEFISRLQSLKTRRRENIKFFMEAHFDKPLDIVDYAYLTGRSISTFQRDFKKRFNVSPKKWLIEKRLSKAMELLRENSDSITDIAYNIGYGSSSHFIKAFQKKYNISPKQFQIKEAREPINLIY